VSKVQNNQDGLILAIVILLLMIVAIAGFALKQVHQAAR